MTLSKKHFENIVGKEESPGNQQFLLLSQNYLPYPSSIFRVTSKLLSVNAFNIDKSILLFGKEIKGSFQKS